VSNKNKIEVKEKSISLPPKPHPPKVASKPLPPKVTAKPLPSIPLVESIPVLKETIKSEQTSIRGKGIYI
jgi:hypothetical protein